MAGASAIDELGTIETVISDAKSTGVLGPCKTIEGQNDELVWSQGKLQVLVSRGKLGQLACESSETGEPSILHLVILKKPRCPGGLHPYMAAMTIANDLMRNRRDETSWCTAKTFRIEVVEELEAPSSGGRETGRVMEIFHFLTQVSNGTGSHPKQVISSPMTSSPSGQTCTASTLHQGWSRSTGPTAWGPSTSTTGIYFNLYHLFSYIATAVGDGFRPMHASSCKHDAAMHAAEHSSSTGLRDLRLIPVRKPMTGDDP